jgi:hypothetical protein
MNVYAIISTRHKIVSPVTKQLLAKFKEFDVEVKLLVNQTSIFEAYSKGLKACETKDDDVIIFCHDDIELVCTRTEFYKAMGMTLNRACGIIGPAGTTHLDSEAVWWNHEHWKAGKHRGRVLHAKGEEAEKTYYGEFGRVVVLDGLFLAANVKVWERIGMSKPDYFEGDWDFYDLHYTAKAHSYGYKNQAVMLDLIHHSIGDTTGRESWHKNKAAFIENTNLPLTC